jgi:hypothetical protein
MGIFFRTASFARCLGRPRVVYALCQACYERPDSQTRIEQSLLYDCEASQTVN